MEFRIADTFTDSLARLTGEEQKAVKTTAFDLQMNLENPGLKLHKLGKAKDKNFWSVRMLKGTLVQIQLCIAKEKILTAARQRGYRFKQKLTLPNGRSRIHLDAKIAERFMT
jgi:mRNA-degrading endonuclease RelE of RelBE toxin-antitoxin system